jgi:hypothetical protein
MTDNKLAKALKTVFQNKSVLPNTDILIAKLVEKFGGIDKFADEFFKVYNSSKSFQKGRMLEGMMRLIQFSTKSKKSGGNYDELSTDDLIRAVEGIFHGAKGTDAGAGGKPADGKPVGYEVPPVGQRGLDPPVEGTGQPESGSPAPV